MADKHVKAIERLQAEECVKNLRKHNFDADFFETGAEAAAWLKEHIPAGSTVGIGGSMTLSELGITDWLTGNPDYKFLDRYHTDDVQKVFRESFFADVYLMSSNAVTLDGCLYNVDANGNRVAALIYGPKKVYVICGVNKIVPTLDDAITRVQQIAAPANNVRLQRPNPCTEFGHCVKCVKDSSICNQFVITRRSGRQGRIHVLLVNEELGY
ncbi:lactate utilization protein [Clostridium vitabionis]|uniref:lactate utilization protein n=1 Tax=Clostridium vitabionis TaxID=2784388 RepID=UPI00188AD6D4|nr:lactate utilization protein [Clostridium vitabionis]